MSSRPEKLDLEAEYNNRARVPNFQAVIDRWYSDAAAYREARQDRSELGVSYGPHPRQQLDILRPDSERPGSPAVLFIHGGYWRSLDRSGFSHMAAGANARGLKVAVAGYRLCPEVTIAEIIDDIRAACLLIHRRFARKIVVCGHSAGGHLAACMAASDWAGVTGGTPADLVRSGLAISGLFDLEPLLRTSINGSLRLDRDFARAASPAFWPVPPGIQFEAWVGQTESSEYLRQTEFLAETWRAAGAAVATGIVPGANHFSAIAPLADPGSPLVAALARLCGEAPGRA